MCFKNKDEARLSNGVRCLHKAKENSIYCGIHKNCPIKWHPSSDKTLSVKSPIKSPIKPSNPIQYYEAPDNHGIIFRKGMKLLPHQKKCLTWMNKLYSIDEFNISGGILQLDMGLGKTLIALYWCLVQRKKSKYPYLGVCDKSLIENWKTEADKFFGSNIKIFVLHSSYVKLDAVKRNDLLNYDLVLTTYGTVTSAANEVAKNVGKGLILSVEWSGVFADEAQEFTNPKTKLSKTMMMIKSEENWCLTGTPIRNSDTDIYNLLKFIGFDGVKIKDWNLQYYNTHKLKRWIKSMDYTDAGIKLPELIVETHMAEFDVNQRRFYDYYKEILIMMMTAYSAAKNEYSKELALHARNIRSNLNIDLSKPFNFVALLAVFTRLRQICLIPYISLLNKNNLRVIDEVIVKLPADMKTWLQDTNSSSWYNSAKTKLATNIIKKVIKSGEKILVFSGFKQMLDLYKVQLEEAIPGINISYLNGSQRIQERTNNLNNFKYGNSNVLFMTYKVGSKGLTLTEASHIILFDPWWTPVVEAQAIARSHRIGQTKNVYIHNILVKDTIEKNIANICSKKQDIIKNYLGSDGEGISLKVDFKELCEMMAI